VDDLAQYPGQDVADFNDYYSRVDETPVTVDSLGLSITSTAVSGETPDVDLKVGLFPNPAANRVTFRLNATPVPAKIMIFDVVGRHVDTLSGPAGRTGEVSMIWTTADLPDGVYIYRVTNGRRSSSGKVVLIH
jgi:hypothetical protein